MPSPYSNDDDEVKLTCYIINPIYFKEILIEENHSIKLVAKFTSDIFIENHGD